MHNRVRTGQRRLCHNWEIFDSLPRAVKEQIWYHVGSTTSGSKWLAEPVNIDPQKLARACTKAYGPRHPQSYEQLFGPSSADLGF